MRPPFPRFGVLYVRRLNLIAHMVDLRPRTPPNTLKTILSIQNPFKFLVALADLAVPPGTNFDPPPEKRHELRQMIVTLYELFLSVDNEGIWKFLIEDGAAHWFTRAQVWLERIGAKRAQAYLDATALAFPRGRIPTDDSKRSDLILE